MVIFFLSCADKSADEAEESLQEMLQDNGLHQNMIAKKFHQKRSAEVSGPSVLFYMQRLRHALNNYIKLSRLDREVSLNSFGASPNCAESREIELL